MTVDERAVHKIVILYEMAVDKMSLDEMSLDVNTFCNTKLYGVIKTPGAVFTTLYFLSNLPMAPVSFLMYYTVCG